MPIFMFKVLPILSIIVLIAGVVCLARGIAKGRKPLRLAGMGLTVLFVVMLTCNVLWTFARM